MNHDLRFFLSHVQVDVICPDEIVLRGLRAIWGHACRAPIGTELQVLLEVKPGAQSRILCDGELLGECDDPGELLPRVEYEIYDLLHRWHEQWTVIHSAVLQYNGYTLLLVGPSGAGKSSLALQAVRQGWTYCSDEIAVTDGLRIWGITRAIQFDATPVGQVLPAHLADTDIKSYRWTDPELGPMCQPIFQVAGGALALTEKVIVVFINSGHRSELQPLSSVPALANLHAACFRAPGHDLGALAARAWTLGWLEPEWALAQLSSLPEFHQAP